MESLMQIIQTCFTNPAYMKPLLQQHALYTLHLVIKTQCSKTLAPSRKLLQEITPGIFAFLAQQIYYNSMNLFLDQIRSSSENFNKSLDHLEMARVSLKSLRRLIVYGYQDFTTSQEALVCFRSHSLFIGVL